MVRRRRMTDAEKALLIEEGKAARRQKILKTSMRIAGLRRFSTKFLLRMIGQM